MESSAPQNLEAVASNLIPASDLPPSHSIENVEASSDSLPIRHKHEDNDSAYWSAHSRVTFRSLLTGSIFTDSTGRQSQDGATWKQALILQVNSGFASGAPRALNYKGVREGREKGGFLPRLKGVGRTGKGPAPIPKSMLKALGVKSAESFRTAASLEAVDEHDEDQGQQVEPGGLESINLSEWWEQHNVSMRTAESEETLWYFTPQITVTSDTRSACEDALGDLDASWNRLRRGFKLINGLREAGQDIDSFNFLLSEEQKYLEASDNPVAVSERQRMEDARFDRLIDLVDVSRPRTYKSTEVRYSEQEVKEYISYKARLLGGMVEKVALNLKLVVNQELDLIWEHREQTPAGEKLALERCKPVRDQLYPIVDLWSFGLELATLDHQFAMPELEAKLRTIKQKMETIPLLERRK